MQEEILEYELIDIEFELNYDEVIVPTLRVCEGGLNEGDEPTIEYDENGIPKGQSMEDIRIRESLIDAFYRKWIAENNNGGIYNDALEQLIIVKGISAIEAKEHSAKKYLSTRAVFILDEILKNAKPVARVPKKTGNKNQAQFAYMLIMVYRHQEIGTIRLTIGVKANSQNVQYGVTALIPGQPLVEKVVSDQKKKKRKSH